MKSAVVKGLFVAVPLVLAACGIPSDDAAVEITNVSYDLLATTTSTSTTVPEPEGPFDLELFFISNEDDSLMRVIRPQQSIPSPDQALAALVAGPVEGEQEVTSIRVPLSELLNPVAAPAVNGFVSVTVSDEAAFREALNRGLATQVIVCTLTQFTTIQNVELRDSVDAIPLSGADAESIGTTASRADFNGCEVAEEATINLSALEEAAEESEDPDTTGEDPDTTQATNG